MDHRCVLMATERGRLQDLIFDDRVLRRHRALAALPGAGLKLGPVKRGLAQRQPNPRYVERLLARRSG